jgi:hypothetical protein
MDGQKLKHFKANCKFLPEKPMQNILLATTGTSLKIIIIFRMPLLGHVKTVL